MDCEKAREVVKSRSAEELERYEFNQFLKHLRMCNNCREQVSPEERARAIHAAVMALE